MLKNASTTGRSCLLAACLGATTGAFGQSGTASGGASDTLEHCSKTLGVLRIQEDTSAPWYRYYGPRLGSSAPLLSMMILQSNCFVVVERGTGEASLTDETRRSRGDEARESGTRGKGQQVVADYLLKPEIVMANKDNEGGRDGRRRPRQPVRQGRRGPRQSEREVERGRNRADAGRHPSTVRLAAAEGYSKNTSFGLGGIGLGSSGALAAAATPPPTRASSRAPPSSTPTTSWSSRCVSTRRRPSKAAWAKAERWGCRAGRPMRRRRSSKAFAVTARPATARLLVFAAAVLAVAPGTAQEYGVYLSCSGQVQAGGRSRMLTSIWPCGRNSSLALIQRSDVLPVGDKMKLDITPAFYSMVFRAPVPTSASYYDWIRGTLIVWSPVCASCRRCAYRSTGRAPRSKAICETSTIARSAPQDALQAERQRQRAGAEVLMSRPLDAGAPSTTRPRCALQPGSRQSRRERP
jgi:hypothetical protein